MQSVKGYKPANYNIAVTKAQAKELHANGAILSEHANDITYSERNIVDSAELIWDAHRNTVHYVNKGRGVKVTNDKFSALMLLPQEVRVEFINTL